MKAYYPMFVDLNHRSCVLIGGGKVAERKVEKLLESGANVTVISPNMTKAIEQWEREGRLTSYLRQFQTGDLIGYFLVIIATDSIELNQKVYKEVNHQTQLVNIVDAPELCTFIVPSMVRRGHLRIAISTQGASPGLAKKIRQDLSEQFGQEYEEYTYFLAEMREWILRQELDTETRQGYFARLLEDQVFQRIQHGERLELVEEMKREIRKKRNVAR